MNELCVVPLDDRWFQFARLRAYLLGEGGFSLPEVERFEERLTEASQHIFMR